MTQDEALKIFGISSLPTKTEFDSLYRQLSKKYHPDLGGSEAKMMKLNAAKDFLIKRVVNNSKKSSSNYEETQSVEIATSNIIQETLKKFDSNAFMTYIASFFPNERFSVTSTMKKSSLAHFATFDTLIMSITTADRSKVFELNFSMRESSVFNDMLKAINSKKLRLDNIDVTLPLTFTSFVYVDNKKQTVQKELYKKIDNPKIFKDPSLLLDRKAMTKIASSKTSSKSKITKKDFEGLFKAKYALDGISGSGNYLYYNVKVGDIFVSLVRFAMSMGKEKMVQYSINEIRQLNDSNSLLKYKTLVNNNDVSNKYGIKSFKNYIEETEDGLKLLDTLFHDLKRTGKYEEFLKDFSRKTNH